MSSPHPPATPQSPPTRPTLDFQLPPPSSDNDASSPTEPPVTPQASADRAAKLYAFLQNAPRRPKASRSRSSTLNSCPQLEQDLHSPVLPVARAETMFGTILKPDIAAASEFLLPPAQERDGLPSREPTPERFYARPVEEHHFIVQDIPLKTVERQNTITSISQDSDTNLDWASSSSESSHSSTTAKPATIEDAQEEKTVHGRAELVQVPSFDFSEEENTPPLTRTFGEEQLAPASPFLLPPCMSPMQTAVDHPSVGGQHKVYNPYFEAGELPPPLPQHRFQHQDEHQHVHHQSHHLPHHRPQSEHSPTQHEYNQAQPQAQTQVPEVYAMDEQEQHIQLRIRIAILENELKYKEKENSDIFKSLGLVARALSSQDSVFAHRQNQDQGLRGGKRGGIGGMRGSEDYGKIESLEREIEDLRRENRGLRERLRRRDGSLGRREEVRGRAADVRKYVEEVSRPTTHTWGQGFWGVGSENSVEREGRGSAAVDKKGEELLDAFVNAKPYQHVYPESLNMEVWKPRQPGESFDMEVPMIPNTPIQQPRDKYGDIAISSLEDILGSENGDIRTYSSFSPSPKGKGKEVEVTNNQDQTIPEEEKTIDEQTADYLAAMQNYTNVPTPKVQQVGFSTTNCIRGKEYDVQAAGRAGRLRMHGVCNSDPRPLNPGAFKIWDSEEQKEMAIDKQHRDAGRDDLRFPDMFRHGLMYLPEGDGVRSQRTVVIGGLPGGIELWELLQKVRGGMVVSAVLADSTAVTGAKSALVQFVSGLAAKQYVDFVSEHPLFVGEDDEKIQVSVKLIGTPTWPMGLGLKKAIFDRDLEHTRCLMLHSFPSDLSLNALEATLAGSKCVRRDSLVDMYFDCERNLHLEFSSVIAAGRARGLLGTWFRYRSLTIESEADPCAGELEELLLESKPRHPLFPREGFFNGAKEEDFPSAVNTGQIGVPFVDSGYAHQMDIIDSQRKRIAALGNQKVEIPSFSGKGFSSSNWADEVNEVLTPPSNTEISPISPLSHPHEVPPNTPVSIEEAVDTIIIDNINEKMEEFALVGESRASNFRKPPVGLAGSKYARLVPRFEDRPRGRSPVKEIKESQHDRKMGECPVKETKSGQNPDEIELNLE